MKLQYKIPLFIFLIMLVIGLIGAGVLLQFQRQDSIAQFEESTQALAWTLYGSLEWSMLEGSQAHIQDAVMSIASGTPSSDLTKSAIREVVIYSPNQEIYASDQISEIGETRNDEVIAQVMTTGKIATREEDYHGKNHLYIIMPIKNNEQCYSCHPPEKQILGAIEIGTDRGPLFDRLKEQSILLISIGGITFGALGVSLVLMLRRAITNPLSKLTAAAQRIAQGDFSVKADVKTNDEVGVVARTFNDMAQQIEEALRRSSQFSEIVMSSINDGICIINVDDYRITALNNVFLEQVGLKEEEVVGMTCYNVICHRSKPCSLPDRFCPLLDTVNNNKASTLENVQYPGNGEETYMDISTFPVKDTSGNIIQVVYTSRNVTERKKAEEREKQLQQEYNLSSRLASIGELAAGVAHEMNNPLTGIVGFSQRLLKKNVSEEVSRDVNRIHNEAQRLAKVVDNLLTFARRREPKKENSDINSIVQKAVELRAYEMKADNIDLEMDLTEEGCQVTADFQQMQQVFLNIILNAEQAITESGNGGKMSISTRRIGKRVSISFENDGPEIPYETLSKLFDPFFTTRGERGGTGLGLSVCHGIVEEHNGRIYAENRSGHRVVFTVELPIAAS